MSKIFRRQIFVRFWTRAIQEATCCNNTQCTVQCQCIRSGISRLLHYMLEYSDHSSHTQVHQGSHFFTAHENHSEMTHQHNCSDLNCYEVCSQAANVLTLETCICMYQVPHTDQSQTQTQWNSGDTEAKQPHKYLFGAYDILIKIFKTENLRNTIFIKVWSVKHQFLHNMSFTDYQTMGKFLLSFCNACFMINVHVLILSSEIKSFIGLKLCDILLFRDDRDILYIYLY